MFGCRSALASTGKLWGKASGLRATVLLLLLLATLPAHAAMYTVDTRRGYTVDVLAEAPAGATALILLFEGGQGLLRRGSKGFAHRAYPILLRHGIAAAMMDAPAADDGFKGGLDTGFRESSAHMSDIDAVVRALTRRYGLPVWVLGTSNGTRSAAAYAIHRGKALAGVVLASSSTDPPFGTPIEFLRGIESITIPLLVIAHLEDQCLGSPPEGAAAIARAAIGSPAAVVQTFSGGLNTGAIPCGPETHHAFYGVEEDVVSTVVDFVTSHTNGLDTLRLAQPE